MKIIGFILTLIGAATALISGFAFDNVTGIVTGVVLAFIGILTLKYG